MLFRRCLVSIFTLAAIIAPARAQDLAAVGFDGLSRATHAQVASTDTPVGDRQVIVDLMHSTAAAADAVTAAQADKDRADTAATTARATLSDLNGDLSSAQSDRDTLSARQRQIPFEQQRAREQARDARFRRDRVQGRYNELRGRAEQAEREHDRTVSEHRAAISAHEAAARELAGLKPDSPGYQQKFNEERRLWAEEARVYAREQEAKRRMEEAQREFGFVSNEYNQADRDARDAEQRERDLDRESIDNDNRIGQLDSRISSDNGRIPGAERDSTQADADARAAATALSTATADKQKKDRDLAGIQTRYAGQARTMAGASPSFTGVYGPVNGVQWNQHPEDGSPLIQGVGVQVAGRAQNVPLDQMRADLDSSYQGLVDQASGKVGQTTATVTQAEADLKPLTDASQSADAAVTQAKADYTTRQQIWLDLANAAAIKDKKEREARFRELEQHPEVRALLADPKIKKDKLDQGVVKKIGEKLLVPELNDRATKLTGLQNQARTAADAVSRQQGVLSQRQADVKTAQADLSRASSFQDTVKKADKSAIQQIIDKIKSLL